MRLAEVVDQDSPGDAVDREVVDGEQQPALPSWPTVEPHCRDESTGVWSQAIDGRVRLCRDAAPQPIVVELRGIHPQNRDHWRFSGFQ